MSTKILKNRQNNTKKCKGVFHIAYYTSYNIIKMRFSDAHRLA